MGRTERVTLLDLAQVRLLRQRLDEVEGVYAATRARGLEGELWEDARGALLAGWAAAAGLAGDETAPDALLRLLDDEGMYDHDRQARAAEALVVLARRQPRLRARALELCRYECCSAEDEVVSLLDASRPEERPLLERLCGSDIAHVAKAARHKLGGEDAVPWWLGPFSRDPLAELPAPGRAAAGPLLRDYARRYLALSETKDDERKAAAARLCALVARLPAPAVGASLPALLRHGYLPEKARALALAGGLRTPDDARLVVEALDRRGFSEHERIIGAVKHARPRLASAVLRRLAQECLQRLLAAPLAALDDLYAPAMAWADLAALLWTPDLDAQPVLERMLAAGEAGDHTPRALDALWRVVGGALAREGWGRAVVRRWLQDSGHRRWERLAWDLRAASRRWPDEEQLALARELLGRPQPEPTARWVVETLASLAPALLDAHWDDPLLRPMIFEEALVCGEDPTRLGRARRELREGRLDAPEATYVVGLVAHAWDGDTWREGQRQIYAALRDDDDWAPPDDGPELAARQAGLQAALGPDLGGPVREAEWDELRRLRALVPDDRLDALPRPYLFPPGPWHPADKSHYLRRLRRAAACGCDTYDRGALAVPSLAKPDPEFLPALRELALRDPDPDDDADWVLLAIARLEGAGDGPRGPDAGPGGGW